MVHIFVRIKQTCLYYNYIIEIYQSTDAKVLNNHGLTYPLGKVRRLLWALKCQGPPKMLFIYETRIKCGHANGCRLHVYYHDNCLHARVERATCLSCFLCILLVAYIIIISQHAHTSLSVSALFSAELKGAALSVKIQICCFSNFTCK